jgi:hypothetical protein
MGTTEHQTPASDFPDGEGDAALPFADIDRVTVGRTNGASWQITLVAPPPSTSSESDDPVVSWGLVLETTGDETPDYVIGLRTQAAGPTSGSYFVWIENLATGNTRENDGPAYGFPVEFGGPDELLDTDGPPTVTFTFLSGSRPLEITYRTRFYAWASVEEGGEVIAWDYAPNNGWIGQPPETPAASD